MASAGIITEEKEDVDEASSSQQIGIRRWAAISVVDYLYG